MENNNNEKPVLHTEREKEIFAHLFEMAEALGRKHKEEKEHENDE